MPVERKTNEGVTMRPTRGTLIDSSIPAPASLRRIYHLSSPRKKTSRPTGSPASILKRQRKNVVDLWHHRVQQELPASRQNQRLALVDAIPVFLDGLIQSLSSGGQATSQKELDVASEEAERVNLPPYSLAQVLLEYRILREVIFDVLEVTELLPRKKRDVVFSSIQEGMTAATSEFVRIKSLREQIALHEAEAAIQRLKDLQMVTEIALSHATDLNLLLKNILDRVSTVFGADSALILLLSEDRTEFLIRAAHNSEINMREPIRIALKNVLSSSVLVDGHIVIVEDRAQIQVLDPTPSARPIRKLLCVPLRAESGMIGVLQIGLVKSRDIQEAEQTLAQLVSDRVAVAIDSGQRFEHSRETILFLEMERDLRSHFISVLTHDIRNPLTAAKISAELLSQRRDRPEVLHSLAARIVSGINSADKRVQDLLDINRIVAGKPLDLLIEELELTSVASSVLARLTLDYGDRFVLDSAEKLSGYWSRMEIERIIEIMIKISIRANVPEIPLVLRLEHIGSGVKISLRDQRLSLSSEQLDSFKLPVSQQVRRVGTDRRFAIDVILLRGIVQAHQGELSAESAHDQGTVLSVILPLDCRTPGPESEA